MDASIYPDLADASIEHSALFTQRVLEVLTKHFPIRAASWYSYRAGGDRLILRAQTGLAYDLYRSFELPLDTPPGVAALTNETIKVADVSSHPGYRDKTLIKRFHLRALAAIPISECSPSGPTNVVRGVLCIYPAKESSLDGIAEQIAAYTPFIMRLYIAAIERQCMQWRETVVQKTGYSHDMQGLLHRLTMALRDLVHCKGASFFLHDPKNGFLRLRATTGLYRGSEAVPTKEARAVFFQADSTDPTSNAFKRKETLLLEAPAEIERLNSHRGFECETGDIRHVLIVPVIEAAAPKEKEPSPLGALRIVNRSLKFGDVAHITTLSWEEIKLIKFHAEMSAVMVHFMERGHNALNDFSRCMHGVKNNLQASLFYLELLEQQELTLPVGLQYSITNAIAFLSDIKAQVDRVELKHEYRLQCQPIHLYKDVLSKIPSMVKRSAQTQGLTSLNFQLLDEFYNDPKKFPHVLANRDALLCVFRNLTENAVKYSDPHSETHNIRFSYRIKQHERYTFLSIDVADDGIGIDPADVNMVFVEGYRTDRAIRRHPSSNGFGLADSRELLDAMGGSIECKVDDDWTTFTVNILVAEKL